MSPRIRYSSNYPLLRIIEPVKVSVLIEDLRSVHVKAKSERRIHLNLSSSHLVLQHAQFKFSFEKLGLP